MAVLRKVGIIGIGHVGAHVANAVLSAGLAEELKLCDINEQKVVSECQDLSDTLGFYPHNCVIGNYGTQYEQLADCDVVINAAGDVKTSAKDRDGELFVMDIFDDIETVVGEVDSNFKALGYNPYFTARYENVEKVWGEGKVVYNDEGALH